ncbi:hypothetical protein NY78_3316 [Desulfovibrio sp. TomC]|nr:hypothetical protein NY78_3316 [Desulfovibrio sp. TomC]
MVEVFFQDFGLLTAVLHRPGLSAVRPWRLCRKYLHYLL